LVLPGEIHFEAEICAHLAAHGWLHAEGDTALQMLQST
jgi:type I restriction enzyme R subunit